MSFSSEMDTLANKLEVLEQLDSKVANALRDRVARELEALGEGSEHDKEAEVVCVTIRKDAERFIKAKKPRS